MGEKYYISAYTRIVENTFFTQQLDLYLHFCAPLKSRRLLELELRPLQAVLPVQVQGTLILIQYH